MRRWHQETTLMYRRWRKELAKHGDGVKNSTSKYSLPYESLAPPCYAETCTCHCSRGIGTMRKRTLSGHSHACIVCNWSKLVEPKNRANNKRQAIRFEHEAWG